jgi:hypothetical protein
MTDDVIKTTLDKRSRVNDLKETLQEELARSQNVMRMKSPNRRRDYE